MRAWTDATALVENRQEQFANNFQKTFSVMIQRNREKFPDLYKAWEDVGEVAEVSLEKQEQGTEEVTKSVEDLTEALKEQSAVLKATQSAFSKAKDIQESFSNAQTQAKEEYEKGLADATEQFEKDKAEAVKRHSKEIIDFDQKTAAERTKMVDDFNRETARARDEFNRNQKQAQEAFDLQLGQEATKFQQQQLQQLQQFQLQKAQTERRQQVSDRRLRAEGDVLALMAAREDFELQQQEAKENFELGKSQADEQFQLQTQLQKEAFAAQQEAAQENFEIQERLRQEDFERQLSEFDAAKAAERDALLAQQAQEIADLEAHFEETKVQLLEQYEQRLTDAKEQQDKQLKQLGDSLKAEGVVTEEGMKEIASKIAEVFGDEGAGDQLIQGWASRSENEFNNLVDNLSTQIKELEAQMKSLDAAGSGSGSGSGVGTSRGRSGGFSHGASAGFGSRPNTVGMREGGSGVVTGPAVFAVEPGVREAFMFAPLPSGGSSNLNMNLSGGFSLQGADIAGKAAVETALETMTNEFISAVEHLRRRRG